MNKRNMPRIENMEPQVDKLISQMQTRIDLQGKIQAPTLAKYNSFFAKVETLLGMRDAALNAEESVQDHAVILADAPDKTKEVKEKRPKYKKDMRKSMDKSTKSTVPEELLMQDADKYLRTAYCLEYGRTLFNMCHQHNRKSDKWDYKITEYECFDTMIRLIQAWYHARFTDTTVPKKGYALKQVNQAIYSFVIMFGYYHELEYVHGQDNALQEFTDEVYDWITELRTNAYTATHFLYPKIILDCIIDPDSSMFTVTALILWEIFAKNGFSKFCTKYYRYTDAPKIDDVGNLYKRYNPDALDIYYNIDEDYSYEAYQIY